MAGRTKSTTAGLRDVKFFERCATILIPVIVLSIGSVQASQWKLSKGADISVGVVGSTSNSVNADPLSAVTTDDEDSTYRTFSVSPFIAASRQSRRLSFAGRAGLVYRDNSREVDAEVNPAAALQATGLLRDDVLWLDGSARVSRRLVGSNTIVDDALTSPDEAIEVYQFSIGPRWEQDLSRTLRANGAYSYGLVDGSGDEVSGSDAHLINFGLLQGLGNGRVQVGLLLEGQRTFFETGETASAEAVTTGISYSFKSNLTGRFLLGRDWLRSSTQVIDEQGAAFGLGIIWRPLRHVFIDAEYQERVFGNKPAVSIGVQGRVSTIEFSWSREASIASGFSQSGSGVFGDNSTGDVIGETSIAALEPEPSEALLTTDGSQGSNLATFASESQNVIEEIAFEYQRRGRITEFLARISHLEQQQLATSGNSRANRVHLSFNRTLSRGVQLGFTVSATDGETLASDGAETDRVSQQAMLTLRLAL